MGSGQDVKQKLVAVVESLWSKQQWKLLEVLASVTAEPGGADSTPQR
jgi:hypothetical protein